MGYTVYKHTSPDGKVYIGATRQPVRQRWGNGSGYKHNPYLPSAIQKFGWDAFSHEIIAEGLSQEDAERLEVELIVKYRATDRRFGYNADKGGIHGPKHSDNTKRKIGEANRGRVWTEESKQKMSESKKGKPVSEETKRKCAEYWRGRKHRPETIEKMRRAQKMRPVKNLTTGEEFPSLGSAARAYNTSATDIMKVCKGQRNVSKGCRWVYAEEVMP